jgi:hypothetical protein
MPILKYYNQSTSQWEPVVVGKEGPQGIQGIQGETGYGAVNTVINGGFDIWQRGTSFTTAGSGTLTYCADRWIFFNYGTNTGSCTQQSFSTGAAPVAGYEGAFFARFNSTNTLNFFQSRIEDVRTLAGQTATLSFFAKSGSAQTLTVNVVQQFGSGGSSQVVIANTVSLTTSWARHTITVSLATLAGKTIGTSSALTLEFIGAINNAVDIWGVQLEAGSTATPFRRAANTLQGELAACQRYFISYGGNEVFERIGTGATNNSSTAYFTVVLPVEMRATPTLSFSSLSHWQAVLLGLQGLALTSLTISAGESSRKLIALNTNFSSSANFGSHKSVVLCANDTLSARIGLSAEL